MFSPYEAIIQLLKKYDVSYKEVEHAPVYTSEQAGKIRDMPLESGAKSLLLSAHGIFILAVIRGNDRLDSKKIRQTGIKDFRFATPQEVLEVMGCEIGACYPFGNLIETKMLVDRKLAQNGSISFNPGRHDRSVLISWQDYEKITNPDLQDIVKE